MIKKRLISAECETEFEKCRRWRSIRILYVTMFFDSLSFSIVLASIWPYLKKIDANVTLLYVGWANIGFQLAGIFMDFLMGYITNKRGSTEPLLISLFFFGFGNLLYGYAQACHNYGVIMVIVARTVIGLSTGTNVVTRAVAAECTTLKERTSVMAHMSIAQGVGFTFGPVAQLIAVPFGDNFLYLPSLKLYLNLYTAPAFASIFIAFLNVIAIILWYREHSIDIYKDHRGDADVEKYKEFYSQKNEKKLLVNKTAIVVNLILYFAVQNAFALQETILAPLAMDQFAWTCEETTLWVSFVFLAAGVVAVVSFVMADVLEKRFNERKLLLTGLVLIFVGFAVYLPWGNEMPKLKGVALNTTTNTKSEVGCPAEYAWCHSTPQIYLYQVIKGMILLSIGYPLALVFTTSIYSKILSPKPQGTMQSFLAATGGTARTAGPSLVNFMYIVYGPRWTFLCANGFVILSILLLICFYKKLIPYHLFVLRENVKSVAVISDDKHKLVVPESGHSSLSDDTMLSIELNYV